MVRLTYRFVLFTAIAAAASPIGSGGAQSLGSTSEAPNPAVQPHLVGEVSRLAPDLLYQGLRARQLMGQKVAAAADGRPIGLVRDIILDKDGRIAALLVEGEGAIGIPEAVYRIPWSQIDLTAGRDGIIAKLASDMGAPEYGSFPGTEGVATLPREYRITELVGDYARLQTGYGYGSVTDAVMSREGRLFAVLVTRDAAAGGGTFAFPAGQFAPGWDPGMTYYGLPFVTLSQADMAGAAVAALSIIPGAEIIPIGRGWAEHFIAYLVLTATAALGYGRQVGYLWLAFAAVAIGGLFEAVQIWAPGRTPSFRDFAASGLGAITGVAAAVWLRRTRLVAEPR